MFNSSLPGSLSRRGSKLLVQMIIGVIGILGIMLAQSSAGNGSQIERFVDENGKVVQTEVAKIAPKIDWSELLF